LETQLYLVCIVNWLWGNSIKSGLGRTGAKLSVIAGVCGFI
jgi:hypothetical protein